MQKIEMRLVAIIIIGRVPQFLLSMNNKINIHTIIVIKVTRLLLKNISALAGGANFLALLTVSSASEVFVVISSTFPPKK